MTILGVQSFIHLTFPAAAGGSDVLAKEFGSLDLSAALLLMAANLYMWLHVSVSSTVKPAGAYVPWDLRRGMLQISYFILP